MSATLTLLQSRVKRRTHIIRATTGPTVEAESGNLLSDAAITDALNHAIRKITMVVTDARNWFRTSTSFLTSSNVQEYNIGDDVLSIDRVVYNVTTTTLAYAYEATCNHTANSTSVTGFTLSASAWAGATVWYMQTGTPFLYRAAILDNTTTTLTLETGSDLPAMTSQPVILEKMTGFTRTASTYEAKDIKTARHEESSIDDPHDAPSATNPMFRFTNRKLRIITSTTNTQANNIAVWVEFIKEFTPLSAEADTTAWPDYLDELAVEYATYLSVLDTMPQVASLANREFWMMVQIVNGTLTQRK